MALSGVPVVANLARNMLLAALAESASARAVFISSIAVCNLVDISLKVRPGHRFLQSLAVRRCDR